MIKEAKFILDKPKQNIPTFILLKFTGSDGILKYSVQRKIHPDYWDFDVQRPIRIKDNKVINGELQKINTELERLYGIVEQYQESCRILAKPVLVDEVRAQLNGATNKAERKNREMNFFTYVELLIKDAKDGSLTTSKGTRYSTGSVINWQKSLDRMKEFNHNLTFEGITLETYRAFIKFCNDRNYSLNYTGKIIKDWKTFMELAHVRKWHVNLIYKDKAFKKLREVSEQVALDEDEIKLLYNLDLSGSKYLQTIRDRYIINLYTGLRISDMKTLTDGNIENEMITHVNKKTDQKVVIPEHTFCTYNKK
jgi:integrase